jgi:hypothetical protein
MDKGNVAYTHKRASFRCKEELNHVIYRKMGRTGDHHFRRNEPDLGRQISNLSLICRI